MLHVIQVDWSGYAEMIFGLVSPYDNLKIKLYRQGNRHEPDNPYAWMLFTYLHQHNFQRKRLPKYIDKESWNLDNYLTVNQLTEDQRNQFYLFNLFCIEERRKKKEINDMQALSWNYIVSAALYILPSKQNELFQLLYMYQKCLFTKTDVALERFKKICGILLLDLNYLEELSDDSFFIAALSSGNDNCFLGKKSTMYLELLELMPSD